MRFLRNNAALIIIVAALIVVSVGAIYAVVNASHSSSGNNTVGTNRTAAAAPVAVTQPPSAKDVADSLNCTGFKDDGPSELGGVVDSGWCWIGSQKYAIDTFMSKAIRDSWLQAAEPLGVNPKWETDTSVTYKSVT